MHILAGLLVALAASPLDDTIYYRAPESASAEDLAKAAEALATRCGNYGYKGIRTAVVDRGGRRMVQVLCEGGLTPEMKAVLNAFGRLSGSWVELRFPAVLRDAEKEQYRPGAQSSEDRAPAGAMWLRFRDPDQAPVLVRNEPVVTRGEMQVRTIKDASGSPRVFWDLSQLRSREIRAAQQKVSLDVPYLIMDGWVIEAVAMNSLEKNQEGKIVPAARLYFRPTSSIAQEALAHPMPVTLQNEEEAENP
jgi:hypothetical protein